jgi:phage-related protein
MGSSKRDISKFDLDLKRAFGFQLRQVQNGETPSNAKPAEVPGTMKLLEDDDTDTYRVVYTVKLKTDVYVLHAFKKKATSGIATPQKDIDLIRFRLKRAAELDKKREAERKNG